MVSFTRSGWVGALLLGAALLPPSSASAIGDASTRFAVFVPPNNAYSSRRSLLVVTNLSPESTTVTIEDDDADGDDDDTVITTLTRGQSYVLRIADGTTNDDYGGTADGDFLLVRADHPVIAMVVTTSNWQHDWVPADNGTSRGQSFFVYSPPTSGADNDINVYAYEDDTRVTVTDVTDVRTLVSGATDIDLDQGELVLDVTLHQGEDLIVRENGLGLDILDRGHTYWVRATTPVTVQTGHLGQVTGGNQARDGAGYVPSANGSTSGSLFFFGVPHNPGRAREKEVRIACFDDATTVSLYGTTAEETGWTLVGSDTVDAGEHLDYVGASHAAFRQDDLYKLEVSPAHHRCTVFEGNWMETGSYGTSDFATAVSSEGGRNTGYRFVAYVGPPGRQENARHPTGEDTNIATTSDGYYSHLYVTTWFANTQVTVTDVDTDGLVLEEVFDVGRDDYYDLVIDRSTFDAMRASGRRPYVEIRASQPITVINANYNDNWMAYLHAPLPAAMETALTVADTALDCGDTVTVTVECENVGSGALSDLNATLTVPSGMDVSNAAGGTLSADGRTLTFTRASLAAGGTVSHAPELEADCSSTTCAPANLISLVAECDALDGAVEVADLTSEQVEITRTTDTVISGFQVLDVPDYLGTPPEPSVEVRFTYQGGVAPGSSIRLLRAINDPDPDATASAIWTSPSSATATAVSVLHEDDYALHHESTYFYRVETTDGSCVETIGPIAVTTSSGQSGGEDSGLESNGSMATALARRAMSRSALPTLAGLPPEPRPAAVSGSFGISSGLGAAPLGEMLPTVGPSATAPVMATPRDLPAYTNAERVAAADYVSPDGERMASLLVVETVGEVYSHERLVCERAAGAEVPLVERRGFHLVDGGAWLRTASRNRYRGEGAYAVEAKLYEQPDGTWRGHSRWLRHHYPEPTPGQRVLNVQSWSARPGLDLTLFEDFLAPLEVTWDSAPEAPAARFVSGDTLASTAIVDIALAPGAEEYAYLRATLLREDGTVETAPRQPVTEAGAVALRPGRYLDVTLDLLGDRGEVVDQLWLSDGAWAPVDDAMWGGSSRIVSFEPYACAEGELVGRGLEMAGCGRVEVEVGELAGVARHFGGAYAPLDLGDFDTVRFTLDSSAAVEACVESAARGGAFCETLPATDGQARLVRLALADLATTDCRALGEEGQRKIEMISFVTREPGRQTITVRDLAFERGTHATVVASACAEEASTGGCRASPGTPASPFALLAWLGALALVRRRRR